MTAIDAADAMPVPPTGTQLVPAGASAASPPAAAKAPWRRTLVRTLLYGRNVDRAAKTKARLGLAILVFGLGYGVIAGRMIMLGGLEQKPAGPALFRIATTSKFLPGFTSLASTR